MHIDLNTLGDISDDKDVLEQLSAMLSRAGTSKLVQEKVIAEVSELMPVVMENRHESQMYLIVDGNEIRFSIKVIDLPWKRARRR